MNMIKALGSSITDKSINVKNNNGINIWLSVKGLSLKLHVRT